MSQAIIAVMEKGKIMNDYIKKEDAFYLIKKRLICNDENSKDEIAQIILEQAPVADVIERSVLLEEADRQEKIGFIQTADVLRKVAEK